MKRRTRWFQVACWLVACGLMAAAADGAERSICPTALTEESLAQLFEQAHALLASNEPADRSGVTAGAPSCIVFLTSSDAGRGFTTLGRGQTAQEAVAQAALEQASRPHASIRRLRLDFVAAWQPEPVPAGAAIGSIDSLDQLGVVGVASSPAFEAALHPEEILAYRMVDDRGALRAGRVRKFFDRFPHRAPPLKPSRKPTRGESAVKPGRPARLPVRFTVRFFQEMETVAKGRNVAQLYRGNRLPGWWRTASAADQLRASAVAAGDYLARNVAADGRFGYKYRPKSNRFADDYNILRHAGTVYSLFELYGATRTPGFLNAAELGLAYLRRQLRSCPQAPEALCLVEQGEIKLGGNALAVLALLEHPDLEDRPELLADARRLGSGIVALQAADGRFDPHKLSWPEGQPIALESIYYPGEACFALARLAARTGNQHWLTAAARGAAYLIEIRDGKLADPDLPHDHWLGYALREIDRLDRTQNTSASRARRLYARRMAGAIAAAQNRRGSVSQPDWVGGFYLPPRSAPTSTRMEGLVAVLEVLAASAPSRRESELEQALCSAADYLLSTQFQPGSALFLAEPKRVLGGFRRSLTEFDLRIDTSQHAISALLGLARLHDIGRISCANR